MTSDFDPVTRFGLLRQIETEWNKNEWIQGAEERPITKEEEIQVQEWGRIMKRFQFDRIMTADKGRAMETALLINHSLGVPLEQDPRLTQRNWGAWSGKTLNQMLKEAPDIFEEQEKAGSKFCPPEGEDNITLVKRSLLALKEAHVKFIRENILVVIHEDMIRCMITHLLEVLPSSRQNSVIYLSNQMHWLYCLQGEMRLENMNALPLPLISVPK